MPFATAVQLAFRNISILLSLIQYQNVKALAVNIPRTMLGRAGEAIE